MGENPEKEIVITYNTLFEILRREKDNDDIQKLDETFFSDLINYIKEKMEILGKEDKLFEGEKEKTKQQITSIKKIVTELYERRERKIINMAVNKSRTKSGIVDDSHLLMEEKDFFNNIVKILDNSRDFVLNNVLELKMPETKKIEIPKQNPVEKKEIEAESSENSEILSQTKPEANVSANSMTSPQTEPRAEASEERQKPQKEETNTEKTIVKVKFLTSVPKFVGTELEEYGPFEEGEVSELPEEISQLLINKARAEVINT